MFISFFRICKSVTEVSPTCYRLHILSGSETDLFVPLQVKLHSESEKNSSRKEAFQTSVTGLHFSVYNLSAGIDSRDRFGSVLAQKQQPERGFVDLSHAGSCVFARLGDPFFNQ